MTKEGIKTLIFLILATTYLAVAQHAPTAKGELITHPYYTLDYCEEHEQASWVYYKLTPDNLSGEAKRKDNFRPDPKVSTGSATTQDYLNSGYDRGHLLPAADCSHSAEAMSESFYMSNISPQKAGFNRMGWLALERLIRQWAYEHQELHIVTGGVLSTDDLKRIGENRVSVPQYFYKVVYAPRGNKMIGFLMPNDKLTLPVRDYAVTIDSLESLTDIDMFPLLGEELEGELEGVVDVGSWSW